MTSKKPVVVENFVNVNGEFVSTGTVKQPITVVSEKQEGKRPAIVHFGGANYQPDEDVDFYDNEDYDDGEFFDDI